MAHLPEPSREAAERVLSTGLANALAAEQAANSVPKGRQFGSLRIDLGEIAMECETHGAFMASGFKLGANGHPIWSSCGKCHEAKARAEREEAEAQERQRAAARRAEAIGAAAIPLRFQTRDFASFVADTPEKRRALTLARDYAEQFPAMSAKGRGLILSGMLGTGKTHLAAAILLHLIDAHKGRLWVQFTSCLAMIRAVRETWRKDSTESERRVLANFGRDIDLLVVDEVGVQYGSDGEQTVLFEILDMRYREMRPTILLTNQPVDGFKAFVGDRVHDRLAETCRWVPFDWPSYRPTARREAS